MKPFLCLTVLVATPAPFEENATTDQIVISTVSGSADAAGGKAVLREAYRRLGMSVVFREMSGAKALAESSSGKVDAELQRIDGISRRFPDLIQVPIPINYLQGAVFSIKFDFPATGWRSLQSYRIGIVEGVIFAREGTEGMRVTVASDYKTLFDLLEADEIDVAVTPRINGLQVLHQRRSIIGEHDAEKPIREMQGVLETLFLYHYVHKSRGDNVPELTKTLKTMLIDGTTRQLREKAYEELLSNK
jgi:polar amino acid transport system substrate-binding protein